MDEQSFSLSTSKPSMGHLFPCSLLYRSYSIIRIDYKPLIILFILCFQTLTANNIKPCRQRPNFNQSTDHSTIETDNISWHWLNFQFLSLWVIQGKVSKLLVKDQLNLRYWFWKHWNIRNHREISKSEINQKIPGTL